MRACQLSPARLTCGNTSPAAMCDCEIEHGLQIVFRGGRVVTKVGPYGSHNTNAARPVPVRRRGWRTGSRVHAVSDG
ncbi:DUF6985 domain-containing protein [Allokutzneria oryzae]|uniref:DUF6985 domain-containing protein n=1 Tax=Allokutzneria oryzae TaxID=1378989 RepID=A0ABV5ZTS8_9PSEU